MTTALRGGEEQGLGMLGSMSIDVPCIRYAVYRYTSRRSAVKAVNVRRGMSGASILQGDPIWRVFRFSRSSKHWPGAGSEQVGGMA